MAPEQASAERGTTTARTDVYGLGAILFEMVTGRPAFHGTEAVEVVRKILEEDPPMPRTLNPAVDRDLEMIILRCLQKPPELRYTSAGALADDLEAYLRHEPVAARSGKFRDVVARLFRETHHAAVLENWGLLWIWHSVVLFLLCVATNILSRAGDESKLHYLWLWAGGLGTWAGVFWALRRRAGPVTFIERQIAHIWGGSIVASMLLYAVEWLLALPPLTLAPLLALIAGMAFLSKAGILSGKFYLHSVVLFATALPMALDRDWGLTIFGTVCGLCFFLPGIKYHRLRRHKRRTHSGKDPSS
jgi:serine/threonine-protein kinase